MLKKKRIVSREYRNRRIGDFLKELQLTEGRATGFPKIYDAMKRNGSPEPNFETDDERTHFLAILPVHPEVKKKGQAGGEVKGEVRGEAGKKSLNDTERAILELLGKGPSSAEELANELSLISRSGFITRTLRGLMKDGFIEFLHPESPRHPEQKYVLK